MYVKLLLILTWIIDCIVLLLYAKNSSLITVIHTIISTAIFLYISFFNKKSSISNIFKFLPMSITIRSKDINYGTIDSETTDNLPNSFTKIINGDFGQDVYVYNGYKYFVFRNKEYFLLCNWTSNSQEKTDWESKLIQWIKSKKQIQLTNSLNQVMLSNDGFIKNSYTTSYEIGPYAILENNIPEIVVQANEHIIYGMILIDKYGKIIYFNKYARTILPLILHEQISKIWTFENLSRILQTNTDTWFFSKIDGKLFNANIVSNVGFISIYLYPSHDTSILKNNRISIIGEMSIGVCHDVNNIIAILLILIDGLLEKYEEEMTFFKCKQFLFKIKVLTNRILSLFANDNQNKKDSFIEVISVLEEWIKSLNQINKRIDIQFVNHVGEIYARIDEFYFGQMIFNIIKNAIDALRDLTKGSIHIDCTRVEIESNIVENNYFICNGKYVKISIRNNGDRITNDQICKIFNKSNNSNKEDGHGIGLGIVLDIIKRHNGLLRIDNENETSFIIYLPEYEKTKQNTMINKDIKILIIEDEYVTRNAICNWLKTADYLCVDSDNLEEAERMLYNQVIDLIILDMNVNGISADYLVTKFMNDKKIIIISGDYSNRNFNHPNVIYLNKPFNKQMIIDKIKEFYNN